MRGWPNGAGGDAMSDEKMTPAKENTPGPEKSEPNGRSSGIEITRLPNAEKVRPPSATEVWDEDLVQLVPVARPDVPLNPKADHLRDRLLATPAHALAPRALISDLLAAGLARDQIAEMVPLWPGLAPLEGQDINRTINRALVFREYEPLRRYQSRFFVLKEYGGHVRICWFDEQNNFRQRSPASWREAEKTVTIEVDDGDGGVKRISAADRWYNSPDRNEYETAEFAPGQRTAGDVLNLWRGWPVGIYPGGTPTLPDKFLDHIKRCMCGNDEAVFSWFMGWMADAVQNVDRTAGTAVVLRGPEGSGKNFWANRFMELFAPHTVMLTNSKQVTGNFNAHLMDKLIVFANEAFFAGNRADAAALKALVTDDTMMVEPKGVDAFQVKKHFRLIIASNDEHVVRVSDSDRRYLVLEVDAHDNNNDREYFGELYAEWENGGREQFMTLLWTWDLSSWSESNIPETRARQAQRAYSLSAADAWMLEMLDRGEAPAVAHDPHCGHVFILSDELPGKTRAFGAALRAAGAKADCRETVGDRQRRGYWLPELWLARSLFAQEKGVRPEWVAKTITDDWDIAPNAANCPVEEKPSPRDVPF